MPTSTYSHVFLTSCILLHTLSFGDVPKSFDIQPIPAPIDDVSMVNCEDEVIIQAIVLERTLLSSKDQRLYKGVVVRDIKLPGDPEDFLNRLSEKFLQIGLNREVAMAIKQEIIDYYIAQGRPVVAVSIPEQDITEGVIQIIVLESVVGNVSISGNCWVSDGQLRSKLHVKEGDCIEENQLLNDVAWINRNPFRQTELIFAPGEKIGTTDLELITKDRFPLRFYVGGDDTGNDFIGNSRLYGGVNWGDAMMRGDLLTYQYTTTEHVHRFQSHYANYTCYLPWQHSLKVYGAYGRIHPEISGFDSTGHSAQASFRYAIPFKPLFGPLTHEFFVGFDYKNTNSNLFFVGALDVPLVTKNVNLSQVVFGYDSTLKTSSHYFTANIEFAGSYGHWLPHQTNKDFGSLRPHATPNYFYGRASVGDVWTHSSSFAISGLLRMQATTTPLLPSEMFSLGGYDTVRGYEEQLFIADDAICANLEIHAPKISFMCKKRDELIFLAFMDYGYGHNLFPFEDERTNQSLWSAGTGMRYRINPYFSLRADYGFKLKSVLFDNSHIGKAHVGATLSY